MGRANFFAMAEESVNGKVIVITGASSGFGKGVALKFARAGASVVLAARRDELLEEVAQKCQGEGGRALAVHTDVSNKDEVEHLAQTAVAQFGQIDVWVNNAGAAALGRFEEVPLADHAKVVETDLLGTIYGSYFAMHQFRKQGSGVLINISSVLGKVPAPYFASYAAAKHGVVGLSAALRQELRENNVEGIHVSTVMPTSMDTPFFEHAANYTGHEVTPIPPVYGAQETIDVIFRMATDPEDEITVGTAGKFTTFLHSLAPGITEKLMGHQTHKTQMEQAPPADNSQGSVQETSMSGTNVGGGWSHK